MRQHICCTFDMEFMIQTPCQKCNRYALGEIIIHEENLSFIQYSFIQKVLHSAACQKCSRFHAKRDKNCHSSVVRDGVRTTPSTCLQEKQKKKNTSQIRTPRILIQFFQHMSPRGLRTVSKNKQQPTTTTTTTWSWDGTSLGWKSRMQQHFQHLQD